MAARKTAARNNPQPPRLIPYALEQLFIDQDRDWITDTIAPVLAWIPGKSKKRAQQPFRFEVDHIRRGGATKVHIDLTWSERVLAKLIPGVEAHARRLRDKRSVQREHVTELAAYGLTFVAISSLMPGRRVVSMQMGVAPDILLDVTPGALRGVETAGRARGGRSTLKVIRDGSAPKTGKPGSAGKARTLMARTDLAEVHISLWCASPRISIMEQLKP